MRLFLILLIVILIGLAVSRIEERLTRLEGIISQINKALVEQ